MNKSIEELIKEYLSKTILELDSILHNTHKHSTEEIFAAKEVLGKKRMEWRSKNVKVVSEIDSIIRRELWFDFHVLKFDGHKLIIGGSIDLIYYHTVEIIFEDIFFVSAHLNGWTSDTTQPVFCIPENEIELNKRHAIQTDYQLFKFNSEDYTNGPIIAANNVSYNTDTVFYYDRQDLQPNERLADFVKKKDSE